MIPGADVIGEQALNQVATFALSTQLDESERLEVQVKTDPGKLAQGRVDGLIIDGEGLVMQEDLRMQAMRIETNPIAVNSLKALTGNLELTEPTQGSAHILLVEADLDRAFNSPVLGEQMQNLQVEVEGKPVTIDIQQVDTHLLAEGKVGIDARIFIQETGETQQVSFQTTPHIVEGGRGVALEEVEYARGKELSPELTEALVRKARAILNLSNFEMEGIALQIQDLSVEAGQLTLQAVANITQFPSA